MMRFILAIALLISYVQAAETFEIIKLKHRSADEIVPLLQGTFEKSLKINGMGNKITVRGDSHEIENLKLVLKEVDRKLRMITLTIDGDGDSGSSSSAISPRGLKSTNAKTTSKQVRTVQVLEGSVAEINGVQVMPVLTGEGVQLQVLGSDVQTKVIAKKGQWTDFAGVDKSKEREQSELLSRAKKQRDVHGQVRIKAEY